LQTISILGALAILGAYVANQLGWINPSHLSYTVANFVGAAILTVVAVVDRQIGFVLLQGAWTLVSLVGMVAILGGGGSLPARGAARRDGSRPTRASRGEDLR
jgi:hypothetical protein